MLDYVYLRCEQWPYSFFVTLASMWFHSSTYTWILQSVVLCRVMDAGIWFLDFANDKFLLLNWYHLEVPDNESGELYLADHITCHFTHLYIDFLSTKHKVFHIFLCWIYHTGYGEPQKYNLNKFMIDECIHEFPWVHTLSWMLNYSCKKDGMKRNVWREITRNLCSMKQLQMSYGQRGCKEMESIFFDTIVFELS